jgi:16S rRNA (guanine527-N7)-methyltransferase
MSDVHDQPESMEAAAAAAATPAPGRQHAEAAPLGQDDERVRDFFGAAWPRMVRFAEMLASVGVTRGLIGPREVPRLWSRHLVNSAALATLVPADARVIDVGSGAGFPGVVLAAVRPDLDVVLLEAMERRSVWLQEVVAELDLTSVEVVRGRAEDVRAALTADVVTARAVAPMDRLAGWTLPLLPVGGILLAMKGDLARAEVEAATSAIRSFGGGPAEILTVDTIEGETPLTVVRVVRQLVLPRVKVTTTAKAAKPRAASRGRGRPRSS